MKRAEIHSKMGHGLAYCLLLVLTVSGQLRAKPIPPCKEVEQLLLSKGLDKSIIQDRFDHNKSAVSSDRRVEGWILRNFPILSNQYDDPFAAKKALEFAATRETPIASQAVINLRELLYHWEYWDANVPRNSLDYQLNRLIKASYEMTQNNRFRTGRYLAMHFDSLLPNRKKNDPTLERAAKIIMQEFSIVPLAAQTPSIVMPPRLQKWFLQHLPDDPETLISNDIETPKVRPSNINCGMCDKMSHGHEHHSLNWHPISGDARAVSLNGEVVGIMKFVIGQDTTYLALRNVLRNDGSYAQIIGGVYGLSRQNQVDILDQPRGVSEVKKLSLTPLTWVHNHDENRNPETLPESTYQRILEIRQSIQKELKTP